MEVTYLSRAEWKLFSYCGSILKESDLTAIGDWKLGSVSIGVGYALMLTALPLGI